MKLMEKEAIPYSQRVEKFSVWYVTTEGKKEKLTDATTIGYKKILICRALKQIYLKFILMIQELLLSCLL